LSVVSAAPPLERAPRRPLRVGILSTYPPTQCGLATFSAALANGLAVHGSRAQIVRVADGSPSFAPEIVGELSQRTESAADVAALLNDCDVAIIQHEYGLYGGADGEDVLRILEALRVPSIVIAHTILSDPTDHQRAVLTEVAAAADAVVIMSDAGRERLCREFAVNPAKVVAIPHGAATPATRESRASLTRPTLLTWGLVGPGKGIERVIDAMTRLRDLRCRPRYLVAGQTHPKVLAWEGEAYREARMDQVRRAGLGSSVSFDPTYRDVLPYDSREQATSGVLIDAIAAGRPVVATAFLMPSKCSPPEPASSSTMTTLRRSYARFNTC
jgi:glycosyltransferase involved in cell wall biosynthesis